MACKICGRSSCTESFHSIEEQERYDETFGKLEDTVKELTKTSIERKVRNLDGNWFDDEFYIKFDDVIEIIDNN